MTTAIVTGGSSGLGLCIVTQLANLYDDVYDWSLETEVDVSSEKSVQHAASFFLGRKVDVLVNCAGINTLAPIKELTMEVWQQTMWTNAAAMWLTAKHLCDALSFGTICNIVSNASHVPMTHSLAYNASKAAAYMITRQMAHELAPTITVFGVSPNKLADTAMTRSVDAQVVQLRGWTPAQAQAYQRSKLLTGKETDPAVLAEFIAFLLSSKQRHEYLQGCVLEYGA